MRKQIRNSDSYRKFPEEVIYKYTSEEAEADGFLFDITRINSEWNKGLFNYVTVNLLHKGYLNDEGNINIPNLLDLLNNSLEIVKKKSNNFKDFDWFFNGKIESPNGEKLSIFIEQNETTKFTIMLAEDW